MMHSWPTFNAGLNALSALLLTAGFVCIRRRSVRAHATCMLTALAVSVTFLVSYLLYHAGHGRTVFHGPPAVRTLYLLVLSSHSLLAAVNVPMVAVTLVRALRRRYDKHRRIARWTWPVWLYVSVTGVVVYVMLYRLSFG